MGIFCRKRQQFAEKNMLAMLRELIQQGLNTHEMAARTGLKPNFIEKLKQKIKS